MSHDNNVRAGRIIQALKWGAQFGRTMLREVPREKRVRKKSDRRRKNRGREERKVHGIRGLLGA